METEVEEFTLFWHGPLSQWEESFFTLDGVEYNCTEQYMMAAKARLFEDEQTLNMIMESDSPKTQKKLGRLVDGFTDDIWQEDQDNGYSRAWNIVWSGNMAKFSQNPWLLANLRYTEGSTLVEASPHDRIWGIGMRESDPGARDRSCWLGLNLLGEVLTSVREHLTADPTPYLSTDDPRRA